LGHVLPILVAIATLLLPEIVATNPAPRFALVLLFLLALPHLFGVTARRCAMRGYFRLSIFAERLLVVSPLLVQVAGVLAFGWLPALERWGVTGEGFEGWPGLSLLAALAPFLVATVLAIDARARLHAIHDESIARARGFQLRLFLSALLPFVVYLALSGLVAQNESWRVHLEEVELLHAGFTATILILFVFLLPRLLTATWDTAPLEPSGTRTLLEILAQKARFDCRELLVWHTGSQMANAAIVGFTPKSRVVLFSDVLLQSLEPFEIAAVFGHEMGHARRRHALTFAVYTLGVLLAVDLVGTRLVGDDVVYGLAVLGVGLALWFLSFSFLSRRFELEADLESLDLMGGSRPIVAALQKVTGAHAYRKSSWRHFSTEQRVHFLEAVERDPGVGLALRARLRRWSRVGLALFLVSAVLQVESLASTWTEDGLKVDLRLGRYDAAAAELEHAHVEGVAYDEGLESLVELAATLPADARTPEALERAARRALVAGEDDRTGLLLELAYLRGSTELVPVLDALDARLEGERDAEAEARLDAEWGSALARRFGAD